MTCKVPSEAQQDWSPWEMLSGWNFENQFVLKDFIFFWAKRLAGFKQPAFQMSYTPGVSLTPTGLVKLTPCLRVWLAQGKGLSTLSLLCHDIRSPLSLSDLWMLEPGPAGDKDVPLISTDIRSGTWVLSTERAKAKNRNPFFIPRPCQYEI